MTQVEEQICDVCHKMWQLGWVAANDGNVSAMLDDGTILTTPTGMSKSFITPDKLIRIDRRGKVLESAEGLRPSSEITRPAYHVFAASIADHTGTGRFRRQQ